MFAGLTIGIYLQDCFDLFFDSPTVCQSDRIWEIGECLERQRTDPWFVEDKVLRLLKKFSLDDNFDGSTTLCDSRANPFDISKHFAGVDAVIDEDVVSDEDAVS